MSTVKDRRVAAHLLGYTEAEPFVAEGVASGFNAGSTFELIANAIDEARKEEAADVIAWLRSFFPPGHRSIHDDIADALERREHHGARK